METQKLRISTVPQTQQDYWTAVDTVTMMLGIAADRMDQLATVQKMSPSSMQVRRLRELRDQISRNKLLAP